MAGACAGCGGTELETGFIEDRGEGSQGYTNWIPGPLELGFFGGAKRLGKDRWAVEARRCSACGLLNLYTHRPGD